MYDVARNNELHRVMNEVIDFKQEKIYEDIVATKI